MVINDQLPIDTPWAADCSRNGCFQKKIALVPFTHRELDGKSASGVHLCLGGLCVAYLHLIYLFTFFSFFLSCGSISLVWFYFILLPEAVDS